MANDYWKERQAKAQKAITDKSIKETNTQLRKYYKQAMNSCINDFEATYNKVQATIKDGKEITPADFYKLDSYWRMVGQTKAELQKLGDKESEFLVDMFIEQYKRSHKGLAIATSDAFGTISTDMAQQMINNIWCADGKSWSDRVWENITKLQQALNDGLIECVVTGKSTNELKQKLREEFNVSYGRASTLVRTEMAHLETVAAQERYKQYGMQEVEVWADYDERRCDVCGKLHQKRFKITEQMPIPAHPNCRCCILPVVED